MKHFWYLKFLSNHQAMTGRAYCLRVGFDQKARVSGLGIVHIMVLRLILWSFCVIPFYAWGQSKQMNVMLFRYREADMREKCSFLSPSGDLGIGLV